MMGSIDCMHWAWSNCPTAWRGQYHGGHHHGPTISLQAVCSYDTWIWSAYFGVPGSLNDINVLEQSPVIEDIVQGKVASLGFYANGNYYPHGYVLADGIYPEYSFLQKTISGGIGKKRKHWAQVQESSRKDVERLFGILKKRFAFVSNPCRLWTLDKIKNVMRCCLILHNMILEDDGNAYCQDYHPGDEDTPLPIKSAEEMEETKFFLRSSYHHKEILEDLIEEAWSYRRVALPQPPTLSTLSSSSSSSSSSSNGDGGNDYDDVNDTE